VFNEYIDAKSSDDMELESVDENSDDFKANENEKENNLGHSEDTLYEFELKDNAEEDNEINKELEDYLNSEDFNPLVAEPDWQEKLDRLEKLDFTSTDIYQTLKRMAVEKYGFMNKKYRRKAWPLLILKHPAAISAQQSEDKICRLIKKI
jgi:hypothetical protein